MSQSNETQTHYLTTNSSEPLEVRSQDLLTTNCSEPVEVRTQRLPSEVESVEQDSFSEGEDYEDNDSLSDYGIQITDEERYEMFIRRVFVQSLTDPIHRANIMYAYHNLTDAFNIVPVLHPYGDFEFVDEDTLSITDIDASDYLISESGRNYVYRYSARENQHQGWVRIRPIHLYGPSKFHPMCENNECTYCIEMLDRFYNWSNGCYDYLSSQISGCYDYIPESIDNSFHYILQNFADQMDVLLDEVPELILDQEGWEEPEEPEPTGGFYPYFPQVGEVIVCTICLEEETCDGETSRIMLSCGHSFHTQCFGVWYGDQSEHTCPLCRKTIGEVIVPLAESHVNTVVEYANTDVLGEVEYDDPCNMDQVLTGQKKYHCYVLTVDVPNYIRWVVKGKIIQVLDMGNNKVIFEQSAYLKYPENSANTYIITNCQREIQIISLMPITIQQYVDDGNEVHGLRETLHFSGNMPSRSILVAYATEEEASFFRALTDDLREIGFNCITLGPSRKENYMISQGKIIEATRKYGIIPGYQVLSLLPSLLTDQWLFEEIFDNHNIDGVIASPYLVVLDYVAKLYRIPISYTTTSMQRLGYHPNIDTTNNQLNHYIVSTLNSIFDKSQKLIPIIKEYILTGFHHLSRLSTAEQALYLVAPELYPEGFGNVILKQPDFTCNDIAIVCDLEEMKDEDLAIVSSLENLNNYVSLICSDRKLPGKGRTICVQEYDMESIYSVAQVVIVKNNLEKIQCALRNGCRVIVTTRDPGLMSLLNPLNARGYAINFGYTSENLMLSLTTPITRGVISSVSLRMVTLELLRRTPVIPVKTYNNFIFKSFVDQTVPASIRRIYGTTTKDHLGIGCWNKDHYEYMEVYSYGGKTEFYHTRSTRMTSLVYAIVEVPGLYFDPKVFKSCVEMWSYKNNCRCAVKRYLKAIDCDYDVDKWETRTRIKFPLCKRQKIEKTIMHEVTDRPVWVHEWLDGTPLHNIGRRRPTGVPSVSENVPLKYDVSKMSNSLDVSALDIFKESTLEMQSSASCLSTRRNSINEDVEDQDDIMMEEIQSDVKIDSEADNVEVKHDLEETVSLDVSEQQIVEEEVEEEFITSEFEETVTFLQVPYYVEQQDRDGQCLYNCISSYLQQDVDKEAILKAYNSVAEEYGESTVTALPSYSTNGGDLIPWAISEAYFIRLVIVDINRKTVTVLGEGYQPTCYLRLHNTHYDRYVMEVDNNVEDGVYKYEDENLDFIISESGKVALIEEPCKEDFGILCYEQICILEDEWGLIQESEDGSVIKGELMPSNHSVVLNYNYTYVLRISTIPSDTYTLDYRMIKIKKHKLYFSLLPYLWDDGLPIAANFISWPSDQVKNISKDRKKYKSLGGRIIPINQFLAKDQKSYPEDIRGVGVYYKNY